ncbi:hypothetical protein SESBI_30769 [Sesbania bispinosa]|nr:hypothetical protein SESBI_30769 [Sesbania bispinosa]
MSLLPNYGVAITEDVFPVNGLSPDATSVVGCDGLGVDGMRGLFAEERWGLGVDAWTCEDIGVWDGKGCEDCRGEWCMDCPIEGF